MTDMSVSVAPERLYLNYPDIIFLRCTHVFIITTKVWITKLNIFLCLLSQLSYLPKICLPPVEKWLFSLNFVNDRKKVFYAQQRSK